jgi:hypothetical protein
MTAPNLTTYVQGQGVVPADGLNTFEQTCDSAAQLRAFTGAQGQQTFLRGFSAPGDGGQGVFWWNYSASSPVDDNGATTIVPGGSTSGCWSRLTGPGAVSASQPANPTGPAGTSSFTMQGLGALIKPVVTGRVLATICGYTFNGSVTTVGDGIRWTVNYGSGAAPGNGAGLIGTALTPQQTFSLSATATTDDSINPFSLTGLALNLGIGTSYWFDLAAQAVGSTGFVFGNLQVVLVEV